MTKVNKGRLTGDRPLPEHVLTKIHEVIVALWPPMVSEILVNTDLSTGMTLCWRQAIISTSLILLLIEPSLTLWLQSKMADILQAAFRMHFL